MCSSEIRPVVIFDRECNESTSERNVQVDQENVYNMTECKVCETRVEESIFCRACRHPPSGLRGQMKGEL